MIESYPLHWPIGYKRTSESRRIFSRFDQTPEKAQNFLRTELQRLGVSNLIVSSNVNVRRDGYLYTDMASTNIDDPGIAIYFKYRGKDVSMCCDQYKKPWENIYALAKGIEALRGMERWGVSEFLDRAFTGFKALPEDTFAQTSWWQILNIPKDANESQIKEAYRQMAKQYHPDGIAPNVILFNAVQNAYDSAMQKFQKQTAL